MKRLLSLLILVSFFATANAQSDSLSEYLGTYKFPAGSQMTSVVITIQDGALFGSSDLGSASFVRVNKDTFSIPEHNGSVYFTRNADKKVEKIHIEVGDMILDGVKDNASMALLPKRLAIASTSK